MFCSRSFLISAWILLFLLPAIRAAAEDKSTPRLANPMIRIISSPRLKENGFAAFTFTGENPTGKDTILSYRLRPQFSSGNIFSGEVFLPAGTRIHFKRDIRIENGDTFQLETFHNGRRLRQDSGNSAQSQLMSYKERLVGFWNDDDLISSFSGMKDFSLQDKKFYPVLFSSRDSVSGEVLSSLQALVILRPDFSRVSQNQLQEVLQYAANGGCVVFAHPRGTLEASRTLLKSLLPIQILSCQKELNSFISSFPELKGVTPGSRELDFLYFLPPETGKTGVRKGNMASFPLYWEFPWGKGVVKVFAFHPDGENFPGAEKSVTTYILSRILNSPENPHLYHSYKEVLDLLTGFSVPGTGVIKGILAAYFLLLLLLAILSGLRNKWIIFWGGSALLALVGTLLILQYSQNHFSGRGRLLARLQLTPVADYAVPESAESFFSIKVFSGDIVPEKGKQPSGFPVVPFRAFYLRNSSSLLQISNPVESRKKSNGESMLASFHIPARSARQYLTRDPNPLFPENTPTYILYLGASGPYISPSAPFRIPDFLKGKVEEAFLILPGKSVRLDISGDLLRGDFASGGDQLLKDALTTALETSLWKNLHSAASTPQLALITTLESRKEKNITRQGKEVFLFPVSWGIRKNGTLFLPPELFSITAAGQSRIFLEGGSFKKNSQLMPDSDIELYFHRIALLSDLQLEELKVTMEITGSRLVTVTPFLQEGKNLISGKLQEDGSWLFRLKGRKITDLSGTGRLILKSALNSEGRAVSESGMRNLSWGINSLQLSGKGIFSAENLPIIY